MQKGLIMRSLCMTRCGRGFYMDIYLVTGRLWQEVYGWAMKRGSGFNHEGQSRRILPPVKRISWHNAVKWANARSEMIGRGPVYFLVADGGMGIY